MEYCVELENVKKRYGRTYILNGISVSLKKGKIYGLLGINGAGKTTMLRVIAGLIPNYSGRVKILGTAKLAEARKKLGSAIESPIFFNNLTALGNLKMYNAAMGMQKKELQNLLAAVGLNDNHKAAAKFSLGMKQKLALAISLLGEPQLVLLDEPTNGLDPLAMKELCRQIVGLNQKKGVSFLISSHDVNELIKISDNFLIMQSGIITSEMDKRELSAVAQRSGLGMDDYIIGLMEKEHG